jgi:hypothetical protein
VVVLEEVLAGAGGSPCARLETIMKVVPGRVEQGRVVVDEP